ncbi:hypothetical protein MHB40_14895 [Lysinibacillus sp. FSL K6-0057]|uniref:hypothetical protein n=1 Tax=Lysinibacillus sp. FSL K6-0057 TaxID=2921411 RepID=UPI00315A04B5
MTNYYDKQSAKVALMHVLKENGWTIFGYTPDESDAMTDYWSPAHWDGVATKNGFVLLVDQYSTFNSGREVKSYNYNGKTNNYDKIKKLEATMNDDASSENEKEVAAKKIEKLQEVQEASYTLEYVFPTFSHKTPKMSMWHIEKDGEILAKGNGLISAYDTNNRELTRQNMENLASKFEDVLNGSEQLVKVEKKVIKKVNKLMKADNNELIVNESIIKLNHNFTGGFYKGTAFVLTKVSEGSNGKRYSFVKLGKKLQKLKEVSNNLLWISEERLLKYISDSTIDVMEIKEVEEVTTKTVYQKAKRKPEQPKGHMEIETAEEIQEEPVTVSKENVTNVSKDEVVNTVTMKLNDEKNGVELYFTDKPSEEIRTQLKSNGFKWSRFNKCWYSKQNKSALALAEQLSSGNVDTVEGTEPVEVELVEFLDIAQFTISEETEKRLIDNSLININKQVGRETTQLQSTLSNILELTKEVVEMADNNYSKNTLINGFNAFCERYTSELSNYLYRKSNTVSWAVTGRSGLNIARYNKKQDQLHNKMMKVVEMLEKQKSILEKYKNKFKKQEQLKTKQAIEHAMSNLDSTSLSFATKQREFEYYGYKYNTRSYESPNYFFMKMAGCYRIFERATGKEIHSMKTADKLTDTKKYVMYLENQRVKEAI